MPAHAPPPWNALPASVVSREARLQWLDAHVRAGTFPNVNRMMQECSVTRRTVFNDVRYLRNTLNAPLVFDRTHGGWRYTEPNFALPFFYLTHDESAALRRALLAAEEFLGDDEAHTLRHLTERLSPYVPAIAPLGTETVGGSLHPTPNRHLSEMLSACNHSIARRQKWRILYHGAHRGENAASDRTIHPLHLHNQQGEWYLIAHCECRDALRTFALSRMEQWQPIGDEAAFRRPQDFSAAALLAQGLHLMHGGQPEHVVIQFDAYQSRWIRERQYHPTQTIEALPESKGSPCGASTDGGLLLSFQVTGLAEVKRWVMSFGSHAKVLEPAALRQEIASETALMQKNYENF